MVRAARAPYHHGKLRSALVVAATDLVLETGSPEISLRGVARRAGVSHAAAYHHFAHRVALLAAVAAAGLTDLTRAMRRAASRANASGGEPGGFQAMGAAYVRFALAKPALYRVMFGPDTAKRDLSPDLSAAARGTFLALVTEVEACQRAGVVRRGAPVDLALAAWSSVHGIASLLLDGQLGFPELQGRSPRALAESVLAGYFVGARAATYARRGREAGPPVG